MRRDFIFALTSAAVVGLSAVGCGGRASSSAESEFSSDSLTLAEGITLYEEGKYDLARGKLMVSVDSKDGATRAESSLYLNALEMELGHWDAARPWLERYHAEMTALSVDRAVARLEGHYRAIFGWIGGGMALALLVGGAVRLRRKRRSSKRGASPPDMERYSAEAEAFTRTAAYAVIVALAGQKERGRAAKVLSAAGQEELDGEITRSFTDFTRLLRSEYPALTEGDVKLCCLSLVPLSSFGRALSFGSTETNIVKQRKHKIKQKLATTDEGRQLFEYVFTLRE